MVNRDCGLTEDHASHMWMMAESTDNYLCMGSPRPEDAPLVEDDYRRYRKENSPYTVSMFVNHDTKDLILQIQDEMALHEFPMELRFNLSQAIAVNETLNEYLSEVFRCDGKQQGRRA